MRNRLRIRRAAAALVLHVTGQLVFPAGAASPTLVYSHGNPTDSEQYLLELVNRSRANPPAEAALFGIDLNEGLAAGTISSSSKQPLAFNAKLIESARGHSQYMLDNDVFTHTGAGGTDPFARMKAAAYSFIGSWTLGENIGWTGTTGTLQVNPTVFAIHKGLFVDAGIAERGHRVNLENPNFREVGLGVREGVYTFSGQNYNAAMITQDFAKSDAQGPFLVGVIFQDMDGDHFYTAGEGLAGVTVRPGDGQYYAVTSGSGGFAIPIAGLSGNLTVKFSGGALAGTYVKTAVLAGANVKVDLNTAVDQVDAPQVRLENPRYTGNGIFTFSISGPEGWNVVVESSDALPQWNTRQVLTIAGATAFSDSVGATPKRFYRARKQ